MRNVLVAGPIHEAGVALLDARDDVSYELVGETSVADLDMQIGSVDGLLLRLTPLSAETIAKAPRLKIVARHGVGYDRVDVAALTRRGIPLAITGEANSEPVAEQAMGLMLAATRRTTTMDRMVRSGEYGARNTMALIELWRKTVLVVGFGRTGSRVAPRCAAFGMEVIVADPYLPRRQVEAHGYRYVTDLREALAEADIVTLHMPANPDGAPVMGVAEFSMMKPGAFFINVARGSLVDEAALTEALTSGHLRGAGLDVTREEPPAPDCPLLALDNVVLSPHVAAWTEECSRRMSEVSVRNILDAFDGRLDPELVVNRQVMGSPRRTLVGAPMTSTSGGPQ